MAAFDKMDGRRVERYHRKWLYLCMNFKVLSQ